MPVLICLREKLWTRTYSIGDQVPTCPVFTRAKIKSRFGILVNLPSQWCFVVCEKWVETGTDCYIDPSSSLYHSSTSLASKLGLLNRGSQKVALSLQAGSHFGIPVSTDWRLLFFGLFTQVHLLIDGSVDGQIITLSIIINNLKPCK